MTNTNFTEQVERGQSRNSDKAVGYILLTDENGQETFYAEWEYTDIETDEDGEVTQAGWTEMDKQDEEQAKEAYKAYLDGDTEYVA